MFVCLGDGSLSGEDDLTVLFRGNDDEPWHEVAERDWLAWGRITGVSS